MEDCYLGKATERVFLPLMNAVLPEVRDFWLPWEGVFHNLSVISIAKEYPGHARRIMSAVWGQGQMSFCKAVVLVDDTVDLSKPGAVLREVLDRVDLGKDLTITEGVLDVLDHSAPDPLYGGKLGVDATRRVAGENRRSEGGSLLEIPSRDDIQTALHSVSELLTAHHAPPLETRNRVLLVNLGKPGDRSAQAFRDALLDQPILHSFSILVLCDESVDLKDYSLVLWKAFNNVDPKRDMVVRDGRVVIDATRKGPEDGHHRDWPEDIVMDSEIVDRVRKRAPELGIDSWEILRSS
jgi:4-hydroxy-3-polyprenylbenzoate decarboxylase